MKDTSEIKRSNQQLVRRTLHTLGQGTKLDVSNASGLSVATCNTILNQLEADGAVYTQDIRSPQVGRKAKVYTLNYNYRYYLCMYFTISGNDQHICWSVVNMAGSTVEEEKKQYEQITLDLITSHIKDLTDRFPSICCISLGIPGFAKDGHILHCDITSLTGVSITSCLENIFQIPVSVENDLHMMTYGCYQTEYVKQTDPSGHILAMMLFQKHICPGAGVVAGGKILKGMSNFSGEISFLPYDESRKQQEQAMTEELYLPWAAKAAAAVITVLNPSIIVLTGSITKEADCRSLKELCRKYIPEEHLPEFVYVKNHHQYYVYGLFSMARELSERKEV